MNPKQPSGAPDRVALRPVSRDDIEIFFDHEHDLPASRLAGVKPRTRDEFLAHWDRILADDTVNERTITVDGAVAGRIASFLMHARYEIGYWIGREFWGKGVASCALTLFLRETSRRPLFAQVCAENTASIRLLERRGFAKIGEAEEPETDRYRASLVNTYRLSDTDST